MNIYPATLVYYDFEKLAEKIDITTSEDGLFRIYSWDTWTGGTMHFYDVIFQYKSNGKVYTKEYVADETDPKIYYTQIFTLNTGDKKYYLAISNGRYSTKDLSQSVEIFTIENNQLNDSIGLIKTKEGLINDIQVQYDFFSVVDRPERPIQLIKYDNKEQKLFIPIVYEDGTVTDRFIVYKFNGQYFKHIETQKKKR